MRHDNGQIDSFEECVQEFADRGFFLRAHLIAAAFGFQFSEENQRNFFVQLFRRIVVG